MKFYTPEEMMKRNKTPLNVKCTLCKGHFKKA